MNTDSLVLFFITIGISTFMAIRGYLKLNSDDKKLAMTELRSPHFIFTIGFFLIGAILTKFGDSINFSTIKGTGIVFLMVSSIVSTVYAWKNGRIKSLIIFTLISFLIFLNVKY